MNMFDESVSALMHGAIEATLPPIVKHISHFLHIYQRMAIVTDDQADLDELERFRKGKP
jgi:hypothetical protein